MSWVGEERRKFPRAKFPCKIVIVSPDKSLVSHTENIGEGEIRVLLEGKLNISTPVEVELFLLDRDKPIKCKGKVVWVQEKTNPLEKRSLMFDTGIAFTDIDNPDRGYIKKVVTHLLSREDEQEN